MAKVHLHVNGADAVEVQLPAGDAVVVGRDVSPDVAIAGRSAGSPPQRLTLPSRLVSTHHVAVWSDGDRLHARDLGSKNGTYLRIGRGVDVTLEGAHDAHLWLGAPATNVHDGAPPDVDLASATAGDFAARMASAALAWLNGRGLHPSVRVIESGPGRDGDGLAGDQFRLPLVDGLALEVASADTGRTQDRWDGVKARLYPWAYDQVARWLTCHTARLRRPLAFASAGAQRALREVLDAARAGVALVLHGESGTGKTELASIYAGRESLRGGRSGALVRGETDVPFVTAHCAHLEPALAHSLLFGALKGSYTSADRTILGAVKLADGGVLFLDDVDALPVETQAKLLRFLDRGLYEPLGHGEREPLFADVRVVAGTNADLRRAVRDHRFREDLYWRLHTGAVVRVPPLRERPEDIERLLRESPGYPPPHAEVSVRDRLDAGALELLHRHPWRGNFRECLRFCARVRLEPPGRATLDRARCEAILAETSLEEPTPVAAVPEPHRAASPGDAPFQRSLAQAVAWWMEAEGHAPERFDELQRFCEAYLKSIFVAEALGLAGADERPDAFDRAARARLGCDLSTVKRKLDDYLERKRNLGGG